PYYAHAWYNTGFILLEHQQDPMAARPYFVEAQRLAPDYSDAYYNVGVTYERTGQLDSAFHWYRMTLERAPEHELGALGLERLQATGRRVGRRAPGTREAPEQVPCSGASHSRSRGPSSLPRSTPMVTPSTR